GPKPRLFQSYICTQVIKQQSPVIPVESSMSAMMQELGLQVTGGSRGTIKPFKEQITRFAACNFTLVGPGPRGTRRHIKTPPIKRFDVWFPTGPKQETLWPSPFNMCVEVATPNLYAVSQRNCRQAPDTRMTDMGRRSGCSSSNDDVESPGPKSITLTPEMAKHNSRVIRIRKYWQMG